ncbi:TIGR04063 family PEP-CTERM/XrtA system glycosyltransferase [Lentisalinibacter salinarum]|uniref:TIGR04063 family PEP-CTERM/XrtA system glycosyltransferase n=1 Tax=Lentisalinibacter salinarum TaxID=2992239 RepID=UPI00386D739A
MSLKILHVLDHSLPLHSGYAFRTLAILREQKKRGWQTLQVTTPRQGASDNDREVIEELTFLRSEVSEGAGLLLEMRATARRVGQAVSEFNPDVIHAHSPVLAGLPAWRVARRRGCRFVYEVRALWEDAAVDHGSSAARGLRYRLSRALETFLLSRADHVTTICEGLRREIIGRGVPAERVTVIPNAVDVERFKASNESGGADLNRSPEEPFRVGFIGSFYRYEGLDVLLQAAARMKQAAVPVSVVLVGGGPEDETLRKLAQDLGIQDIVTFTGRVPNAEVASYYDTLDALVYPRRSSRLTEMVTPLKPLEAMANGKLVLATDIGGHRELIEDGVTGLFFPPGDEESLANLIEEVAADARGSSSIPANGLAFVREKRNWRVTVGRYESVYE